MHQGFPQIPPKRSRSHNKSPSDLMFRCSGVDAAGYCRFTWFPAEESPPPQVAHNPRPWLISLCRAPGSFVGHASRAGPGQNITYKNAGIRKFCRIQGVYQSLNRLADHYSRGHLFQRKWLCHFHILCPTAQRSAAVPMKTLMMRSATGPDA
jgi:hypothetical protein